MYVFKKKKKRILQRWSLKKDYKSYHIIIFVYDIKQIEELSRKKRKKLSPWISRLNYQFVQLFGIEMNLNTLVHLVKSEKLYVVMEL